MKRHEQILERMRTTNPVPELNLIHDSDLASLTSLFDERRLAMTDLKEPRNVRTDRRHLPRTRRWTRPAWIFAVAITVVLATVGAVAFLTERGSDVPDVGDKPIVTTPTSLGPATTQPATESPTTTPAPATTVPAPIVLGPPIVGTFVADITFDAAGIAWVSGGEYLTENPSPTGSTDSERFRFASDIYRFADGTWTSIELPEGFSVPRGFVWTAAAAPDGSIWFPGVGGLAQYADGTWAVFGAREGEAWNAGGQSTECVSVTVDTSGGVWAVCPDTFVRLEGNELVGADVEVLGEEAGGAWVAAGPDGSVHASGPIELLSFDGLEWSMQTCPASATSPVTCVHVLGVEPDGDVWTAFGWEGVEGLIHFQGEDLEPELVLGEADGAVDMAYTDDGILWFAVPQHAVDAMLSDTQTIPPAGLFRFDGIEWRHYTTEQGLASDSVLSVEIAPDGTLWVGTGQGLNIYDQALDRFAPPRGES